MAMFEHELYKAISSGMCKNLGRVLFSDQCNKRCHGSSHMRKSNVFNPAKIMYTNAKVKKITTMITTNWRQLQDCFSFSSSSSIQGYIDLPLNLISLVAVYFRGKKSYIRTTEKRWYI